MFPVADPPRLWSFRNTPDSELCRDGPGRTLIEARVGDNPELRGSYPSGSQTGRAGVGRIRRFLR